MDCLKCKVPLGQEMRFCPSCGTPAGKKSRSSCVLIGIIAAAALVPIGAIVLIIAAIAIPNLLNAVDRGKQKRTMADLRSIATAIESYSIDHDFYPTATGMDELRPHLEGRYLRIVPPTDGWEHAFHVNSDRESYELISGGKDGVLQGCTGRGTINFNADICFADGQFTQWPEGTQQ